MSELRLFNSTMSRVEMMVKANCAQMLSIIKPTATQTRAARVAVTGSEKRLAAILFCNLFFLNIYINVKCQMLSAKLLKFLISH